MIMAKFALDANILIYSHDKEDLFKQNIVASAIAEVQLNHSKQFPL
jgi:predicted nucleic acid-binding protein